MSYPRRDEFLAVFERVSKDNQPIALHLPIGSNAVLLLALLDDIKDMTRNSPSLGAYLELVSHVGEPIFELYPETFDFVHDVIHAATGIRVFRLGEPGA